MKKVIALLIILAVLSTTLFAAPVSVAGSWNKSSSEFTRIDQSFGAPDDLFADVNAVALTPEEALAVEGEGWLSCLVAAVISTAIVVVDLAQGNTTAAAKHLASGVSTTYFAAVYMPF